MDKYYTQFKFVIVLLLIVIIFSDTLRAEKSEAPYVVRIERLRNFYQGQNASLEIYIDKSESTIGEFNFIFEFDPRAMQSIEVIQGEIFDNNTNKLNIIIDSMSNESNKESHLPTVRLIGNLSKSIETKTVIATLKFLVPPDRRLECERIPIRFIWSDCFDNTIHSKNGKLLYGASKVSNYFPTFYDKLIFYKELDESVSPYYRFDKLFEAKCLTENPNFKDASKSIEFYNGEISIACVGSIDIRGDINLNEIMFEREDSELLIDYFLFGRSVFEVSLEGQIAATDVNADGIPCTILDLVFLNLFLDEKIPEEMDYSDFEVSGGYWRKLILKHKESTFPALYIHNKNSHKVLISTPDTLGGAYLIFDGHIVPELKAITMQMRYNFDEESNQTKVVIYTFDRKFFTQGELITYRGDGTLVSAETSGKMGMTIIESKIEIIN